MSLENYFQKLIIKVEESDISNQGKDRDGFYKPTRTILIRHLNLLKDLHGKLLAKKMTKASWEYVVEHVPPEWLALNDSEKAELKEMLK
jgi:hypothetical protein